MNIQKIKRHHLIAFVKIAEMRKIRAASAVLGLSQPSLSRTLKELEAMTGLALVVRANDGISLTNAGKQFFVQAKNILNAFKEMEDGIRLQFNRNSIAVGLGGSLNMLLPEVINQLRHYDITLIVCEEQTDNLLRKLMDRELDFCITTVSPHMTDPRFLTQEFLKQQFGIFVSQNHPLKHATTIKELYGQRWIMPPVRTGYHSVMTDFLTSSNMNPSIPVQINNMFGVPAILDQTDLLSILPVSYIQNSGWKDKLVQIKIDSLLPMATYYLSYRKNEPLSEPAIQVINTMRHQIADTFPDSYLEDPE
ncbi:TPA: LysR family transcriptional regulator [Citrobacter freundii]|nr:LysR family transcriptional regulator [Citrobacter freundii]